MFPPKKARSDWKIIFLIFKLFMNLKELNLNSKKIFKELNNYFYSFNFFIKNNYILSVSYTNINKNTYKYSIYNKHFYEKKTNIFRVNQISRSSLIINKCLNEYKTLYTNFI
jgi:hypothetical protein